MAFVAEPVAFVTQLQVCMLPSVELVEHRLGVDATIDNRACSTGNTASASPGAPRYAAAWCAAPMSPSMPMPHWAYRTSIRHNVTQSDTTVSD